jgi:hypothetical protein
MPSMMPAIWVYSTDGRWNAAAGSRWPSFFSKPQQARLERLRQARMLFDGKHREYFLDEDRSQFYFKPLRLSNGRVIRMYQKRNMLKLISLVSATLLLGQESLIRCKDAIQQSKIDELKETANLHAVFLAGAISCSYNSEVFLESQLIDGQVYVQEVPADQMFPVGTMLPNWQYNAYDRYEFFNAGTEDKPIWLMLITHMLPGVITRECWQCEGDSANGPDKPVRRITLDNWTPNPALADSQRTGIAANTITYIPNLLHGGCAVSDYDGVIDGQDKVNAKETQLSRVIAMNVDPKLAIESGGADDQGNNDAGYDVYYRRQGGDKDGDPAYITFDGQLDAALADRKEAVMSLLIETETSPTLVGFDEGAAAESFKTVRLRSLTSINKAARKALLWRSGISRVVGTCLDLMQSVPGQRFDRSPIEVTLRDGIPTDPESQATVQATLKTAGLMSVEDAVEQRYSGDAEGAAKEIARIKANQAEATPSVFLGGGGGDNTTSAGPNSAGDATGSAKGADETVPDDAAASSDANARNTSGGGYQS